MGIRDPNRPQLDFPQLVADIITQLRLTGQVGLLDFSDVVSPVYIVASRSGALDVVVAPPLFSSGEISTGTANAPVANQIFADTGQLAAGDYDLWGQISCSGNITAGSAGTISMEHRNAANTATLATLLVFSVFATVQGFSAELPLTGYTLALNERIRFINLAGTWGGFVATTMGVRRRPTP